MLKSSFFSFLWLTTTLCQAMDKERNSPNLSPSERRQILGNLSNKKMGSPIEKNKIRNLHGEKNYKDWINKADSLYKNEDNDLDRFIIKQFGSISNCIYQILKQPDFLSFQELLDYLISKNTITRKNKFDIYMRLLNRNALAAFDYFVAKFPINENSAYEIFHELMMQNVITGFKNFVTRFPLAWGQPNGFIEKGAQDSRLLMPYKVYVEEIFEELARDHLKQKFIFPLIEGMVIKKPHERDVDYGNHRIDVMYIAACRGNVDLLKEASLVAIDNERKVPIYYQLFSNDRKVIDTLLIGALYYKQEESIAYLVSLGAGIPEIYLQSEEEFKKYLDNILSVTDLREKLKNLDKESGRHYERMIKKGEVILIPWEVGTMGQASPEGMRKLLLEAQQRSKKFILKEITFYGTGANNLINDKIISILSGMAKYLRSQDRDFVFVRAVTIYLQLVNNNWDSNLVNNFSSLIKSLIQGEKMNTTDLQELVTFIGRKVESFIDTKPKIKTERAQKLVLELEGLIKLYHKKAQEKKDN